MKITITIDTSNAAFEDDPRPEVSRILADLARKVASRGIDLQEDTWRVRDIDGNTCGTVRVEEDTPIPECPECGAELTDRGSPGRFIYCDECDRQTLEEDR